MDTRESAALVLARMALADGTIDPTEREFLAEFCREVGVGAGVDTLIETAGGRSLEELVGAVRGYEDRFFIALRAYLMARVDASFDVSEERLFGDLVAALEIRPDDRRLIERTHRQLEAEEPGAPDPRIMELYRASSFFVGEDA